MSGCNSDLELEGAAERGQGTSSGYVGSVSVEGLGESVARAQLSRPMGEASAESSSEGAASAAGSGNILGNKRQIEGKFRCCG